jgi:hypothetical protein
LVRSWWQDDLRLLNHLATMILPKNIFKFLALFPCLVAACPRCAITNEIFAKKQRNLAHGNELSRKSTFSV